MSVPRPNVVLVDGSRGQITVEVGGVPMAGVSEVTMGRHVKTEVRDGQCFHTASDEPHVTIRLHKRMVRFASRRGA